MATKKATRKPTKKQNCKDQGCACAEAKAAANGSSLKAQYPEVAKVLGTTFGELLIETVKEEALIGCRSCVFTAEGHTGKILAILAVGEGADAIREMLDAHLESRE